MFFAKNLSSAHQIRQVDKYETTSIFIYPARLCPPGD